MRLGPKSALGRPIYYYYRFLKWKNNSQNWKTLEIPCSYQTNKNCDLELHISADASAKSYGAVAYFTSETKANTNTASSLLNQDFPIKEKQLTVPTSALQAALFPCGMKATILEQVNLQVKAVFLRCNSKTVINYINNGKTDFGAFAAHRVNKIRNSSKTEEWFYVPTNQNVVDNLIRYKGFNNLTKRSR